MVYRVFSCIQCVFSVYSVCIQYAFSTKKFRLLEKIMGVTKVRLNSSGISAYEVFSTSKRYGFAFSQAVWVLSTYSREKRFFVGLCGLYCELQTSLKDKNTTSDLFSGRRNFFVLNTHWIHTEYILNTHWIQLNTRQTTIL